MSVAVSVVIAAKNEELYVDQAVRSVLAQKGVSFELIFVDDSSTDRTLDIVRKIATEFDNLRIVENGDPGKVKAFNLGVGLAQGDWVCIFAGDDIMPEDSLAKRWQAVKDVVSSEPVVGVCQLRTLADDPKKDGRVVPRNPNKGSFSGACYMMGKAAREKMWPVPTQFPNEDTWLELCAVHLEMHIVHTPIIGCIWRMHANNSINIMVPYQEYNRKFTARMAAAEVFFNKYEKELSPPSRAALRGRVDCERARREGRVLGIFLSKASFRMKLKSWAYGGPIMYYIRKRIALILPG